VGAGRRVALLAAAPAAAIALAACGADDESPAAGDNPVAAAATLTLEAGSSSFTQVATIDITALGADVSGDFTAEGEFEFAERRGRYTLDLTDLVGQLGVPGSATGEVIREDTVVYLSFPLLSLLVPGATEWIKIDLGESSELAGFDLGRFNELVDPALYLAYLQAASDDAEDLGSEDVSGTETTHYRTTVDLERALETAPASQQSTIQALIDADTSLLPADVWIDDDGLVRKIAFEFPATDQPGAGAVTMELSDFGVEVTLDMPSDDEVTDIAELQSEVGGASTA
jgi:hypothetical protein